MNIRRGLFWAWAVLAGLWWAGGVFVVVMYSITDLSFDSGEALYFAVSMSVPIGIFVFGWFVLTAGAWILKGFRKSDSE